MSFGGFGRIVQERLEILVREQDYKKCVVQRTSCGG